MSHTNIPYDDTISDTELLTLHPELQQIFAKHGQPRMGIPTRANLPTLRKGFAAANARFNNSPLARNTLGVQNPEDASQRYWHESDHEVPVRDGSSIPVRIYRPKSVPQSGVPVVVLMHGGGWVMGDVNTEAFLARSLCAKLGVLVVNVGFRNYPDVKFGVPTTDCYDAVKWTAQEGTVKSLGGNCEIGFVLAGVSGGCSYATVSAHMARDEGLSPGVTGQWLTCPVLSTTTGDMKKGTTWELFDTETVNRSMVHNKDAPLMNRAMQDAIIDFADYVWDSKLLTPFLFDSHKGLGSGGVYVQVTGLDPWRDAGRIYAGLCRQDGSRTKVDVYSGMPHCWWTYFPMLKVTQQWVQDSVKGLRWLLEEQSEKESAAKL